jgi:hypothetical protein
MSKRHRYGSTRAFLDLLFNNLVLFAALFMLSFILIKPQPETSKKNVEVKAEFIVTVTWPEESADDVDSYLEDPYGNLVYYQNKEVGLMHLDRDDLGKKNDKVKGPNGEEITFTHNREILTVRGIVPGEYVMNVHMYRKNSASETPVTIQVDKLNPYSTVVSKKVVLLHGGEEKTVVRFTVNKDGKIISTSTLQKRLSYHSADGYQGYQDEEDYGE